MKTGAEYLQSGSKRTLDIVGGLAIGSVTLPVAAVIGATTMIDTRAPHPFFVQERAGRHAKSFNALKFRTIPKDRMSDITYGTFDPRTSRWGQMLRQTGIDEIPQICNVLLGTMSLVGARPMIYEDIDFMNFSAPDIFDEWYAYIQLSRPGLAGPSQVYRHGFREGKNREIYRKSAELDLRYFDKASMAIDIGILARTPLDMFYANANVVENQSGSTVAVIDKSPAEDM